MNRYPILLILLAFIFGCSRNIPVASPKSDSPSPPTVKTLAVVPKKETKITPSKRPTAKKASLPAKLVTTYQSTGNDLADIVIKLFGNKRFSFQMTIKPKEGEKKDDRILIGGTWKYEADRTVLLFDRKEVDLNALFDKTYATGPEFEILDAHRVAINTQLALIHIWGVACEKK